MTSTTSEPQTEAGRALYEVSEHMTWSNGAVVSNHYILETILAIESEAQRLTVERLREARAELDVDAIWEHVRLDHGCTHANVFAAAYADASASNAEADREETGA